MAKFVSTFVNVLCLGNAVMVGKNPQKTDGAGISLPSFVPFGSSARSC